MTRPKLDENISIENFQNYYWLKKELVDFCRNLGINKSGGKIDISYRIEQYLKTGEKIVHSGKEKSISKFNWNSTKLDLNTLITDNFSCTENVRSFFKQTIGENFKFNVPFLKWLKSNNGKTLEEAIEKWKEINAHKKDNNFKTEIAPQFEYNTYIREFMSDNRNLSMKDAINCWNSKRYLSGRRKYQKEDLTNCLHKKSCD